MRKLTPEEQEQSRIRARERSREWMRKKRSSDSEFRERADERNREYIRERRASDPEWAERRRAYAREYYARNRDQIRQRHTAPEIRKKNRDRQRELRANNPEYRAYVRRYQKEHKERNREHYYNRDRRRRLQSDYGLTPEQYNKILEAQGGLCAICKQSRKLHVDHCHESGVVRGLLCRSCNTALGKLGDTSSGLMRAVRYLRNAERRQSLPLIVEEGD